MLENLLKRFRDDILYDCHSLSISYDRSKARAALLNLEPEQFIEVASHVKKLGNYQARTDADLRDAWIALFIDYCSAKNYEVPHEILISIDLKTWADFMSSRLS